PGLARWSRAFVLPERRATSSTPIRSTRRHTYRAIPVVRQRIRAKRKRGETLSRGTPTWGSLRAARCTDGQRVRHLRRAALRRTSQHRLEPARASQAGAASGRALAIGGTVGLTDTRLSGRPLGAT